MIAQEYLEKNWSDKSITTIGILSEEGKLTGELIIQDYPNLQEIDLPNQELTSLTVSNCPNLKKINLWNNQLTKLEVDRAKIDAENKPTTNEIKELIVGGNKLSSLDLINCPQIKNLMVSDNPYLTEIKGLNLSIVINLNIANTSVNLASDYEELQAEKERLLEVIENLKKGGEEGKLMLTEAIESSSQVEEAIQRHLQKTEKEWIEYLTHPEKALPAFQVPESCQKAKKVLILIAEAQTSCNYQELADKWNEKGEYNGENDFDCSSLKTLMDYLKVRNYFKKKEGQFSLNTYE